MQFSRGENPDLRVRPTFVTENNDAATRVKPIM